MEKHLILENEALKMASDLSDIFYYADNFSKASFAVFCKNLPKPVKVTVINSSFKSSFYCTVTLVFSDFTSICILFDLVSDLFSWFTLSMLTDWHLHLDHTYSYQFYKS